MRILPAACMLLLALASMSEAKKPSRSSAASSRPSSRSSRRPSSTRESPVSRRRVHIELEDEDEDEEIDADFDFVEEEVEEEDGFDEDVYEEEEEELRPIPSKSRRPSSSSTSRPPPRKASRQPPPASRKPSSRSSRRVVDEYEDDYDRRQPPRRSSGRPSSSRRGPPPRGSSRGGRRGPPDRSVVPYGAQAASTFTRGLSALRDAIPDPAAVRDAAAGTINAARETTSKLSSNIYREVKGLTSSELEQVMLKATRPDDTPVKGKHVERLVGVTYQISARYDIYDAVLRKLWGKMAEKDWRTTVKALYILHRFAADGAPEHQAALKVR